MTLAVAEALGPNKPNLYMTLAVAEALSPNKPSLDMTLAVAEALGPNKPNRTVSKRRTQASTLIALIIHTLAYLVRWESSLFCKIADRKTHNSVL